MDLGAIKGDDLRFLHQAFISDTISHALELDDADVRLYYVDESDRKRFVEIVLGYLKKNLPANLAQAFKKRLTHEIVPNERWGVRVEKIIDGCFASGYENVLIVGSRTPTIRATMMRTALKMLKESDVVFGPTPEGRYYVIGMTGEQHVRLSDFDWKSPKIYSEVADAFTSKGLAWSELEIWYAVETPDDLELMVRDINQYRFEGDIATARETEIVMERILAKLTP